MRVDFQNSELKLRTRNHILQLGNPFLVEQLLNNIIEDYQLGETFQSLNVKILGPTQISLDFQRKNYFSFPINANGCNVQLQVSNLIGDLTQFKFALGIKPFFLDNMPSIKHYSNSISLHIPLAGSSHKAGQLFCNTNLT